MCLHNEKVLMGKGLECQLHCSRIAALVYFLCVLAIIFISYINTILTIVIALKRSKEQKQPARNQINFR